MLYSVAVFGLFPDVKGGAFMRRHRAAVPAVLLLILSLLLVSCGEKAAERAGGEVAAPGDAVAGGVEAGAAEGRPEGTVLLVVCQRGFQEKEYKPVREALESAGIGVKVASPEKTAAEGVSGTRIVPDITLGEAHASDYLAVVFIGGPGTESLYNDEDAYRLALEAVGEGKVLAAICIAPAILARAGVLQGRRATAYSSASGELTAGGATYTGSQVEVDGSIVTANGPDAAAAFAQAILQKLH